MARVCADMVWSGLLAVLVVALSLLRPGHALDASSLDPEMRRHIEEKLKDMPPVDTDTPHKIPAHIHDAVLEEDTGLIAAILSHGGDINEIGQGGQTPLIHAILNGKETAVDWLLENGADPSIPEDNGYTAMHAAAFAGKPEVVKVLLKYSIDPADVLKDGFAPIHRACWGADEGHTTVVRLLLKAGVPFNQRSASGHTPLDIVQNRNPRTAAVLRKWAVNWKKVEL